MSLPVSGSQQPLPFPLAIKKVHDRCEFLYSRFEQSTKGLINTNPSLCKTHLQYLKAMETSVFSDIKEGKSLKSLKKLCKNYEKALERLAKTLPESIRPQFDSKNNRTLTMLAEEAIEAGQSLSPDELKNAYLSECQTDPYPLLTEAPGLIAEVLSKNVSLKDLNSLLHSSKKIHPEVVKESQQRRSFVEKFGENAPPLKEVIGSQQDKDVLRFFNALTDGELEDVRSLNFGDMDLEESTISHILNLCSNVKEVIFHYKHLKLSKDLLQALSDNPQIEKIDIKYLSLQMLPEDFVKSKLTGIKLRPRNDAALQQQLQMLVDQGARIKHLALVSPRITRVPQLPDELVSLDLSGCLRVTEIQNFPRDLKYFIAEDTNLQNLPQLSEGMEELILSGNEHLHFPDLPNSIKTLAISNIEAIQAIVALPENLEHLECRHLPNLARLPETLPRSLRTFVVAACPLLENLPPIPPNCKLIQED